MDPYEWLPGYGESKVSFRSAGLDLILDVDYEKEVLINNEEVVLALRREITFNYVRCFIREPFPGGSIFEFDSTGGEFRTGQLTEFTHSEWLNDSLRIWSIVSSQESPKFRHFSIQFLSENLSFDVLAVDVFLSAELPGNLANKSDIGLNRIW